MWYESLRPIEIDWPTLQEHFRQQYSKFDSTREQYFHVWRSFHYDENTDTIDSYISKIKQVTALLNYGELQILELFKNTLPSKLYWILFPINNLQEAVDAAKRVLTKENVDKQLSGQTANSTPFMKMGDTAHPGKKVSINPQDLIGEKLENLTSMMYKMSIQQQEEKKLFKPQVYPKRGRGQRRQNFGNRDRSRNNDRQRQNFRQTQNRHGNDNRRGSYRQNIGRSNNRDRGRQNFRRNYDNNDRSRSRERSPTPRRYTNRQYNNPSTNSEFRSRSNSRLTTNRDRIRCFRCREYDHFANECPNTGIEDSDGYELDSAALQLMATDTEIHDSYDITRFTEEIEHLN